MPNRAELGDSLQSPRPSHDQRSGRVAPPHDHLAWDDLASERSIALRQLARRRDRRDAADHEHDGKGGGDGSGHDMGTPVWFGFGQEPRGVEPLKPLGLTYPSEPSKLGTT